MASSSRSGTLDSWTDNAEHWDKGMGSEGNKYWRLLELPSLKRMVPIAPGCKALDLATGNGLCARWLASEGASVLATDGSERMLEFAAARTPPEHEHLVEYKALDATREEDFERLLATERGREGFDVILMNMAIMDIETLDPLAAALPNLLKKDGVFVATLLHPVFVTSNATQKVEIRSDLETGRTTIARSRVITQYLNVPPYRGVAFETQPEWQLYFHRPLHELFGVFFKAGLVLDALEEPHFTDEASLDPKNPEDHSQIPVLFAFRLRQRD
ncbi:uncharacterized protein DNG_09106 [Cephalotrichum gorgonifer]|uniref:Methyltransferase type 12 domain-containing protein n=1 Tax=Cephalotrichum gorgonifer TaxID=2041049 RepID=A0AAE8N517_9PEZI|nr:uncharacterized protein DNG_09106 [Cephalotrichum gorgonifer]